METGLAIVGLIICLVLIFQRWFWLILFGLGSLVSCIALLTSIFHFNIFSAIGYMIVMIFCWSIAKGIADGYPPLKKDNSQKDGPKHKNDNPDWSPH